MRKRTKHLAGLPSEHRERAADIADDTRFYNRSAKEYIAEGKCDRAFRAIQHVLESHGSYMTETVHGQNSSTLVDEIRPTLNKFESSCIRRGKG